MVVEGPPCACRRACGGGLTAARRRRVWSGRGFCLCEERKSVKMTMGQKIFGPGVSGLNDMPSDGIGLAPRG